jgi:hypothetical protein
MISAMLPLSWMLDYASPYHVEVDIQKTPGQMFICLYGGRIVWVSETSNVPILFIFVFKNTHFSALECTQTPQTGHFLHILPI